MKRVIEGIRHFILRLRARMRAQRFDHVVLTGNNCELAFRFLRCLGFLDATLFCWAGSTKIEDLLRICDNIDDLMTGELDPPTKEQPLFRCAKTGLWAHGRSHASTWATPQPPEFVKAEADEVRSRILHLKDKTLNYLRDEKSVLVVHKIRTDYCEAGKADSTALAVRAAMERLGARNMTFLVVCEDAVKDRFPKSHPGYELRSVAAFNPGDDALNPKLGDRRGWQLIFDEFRPRKMMKRKKTAFKFEQ